jgi:hypothetical protein
MNAVIALPVIAGAVVLVVPPARRRAVSVGKAAATTGLALVMTTLRGATDVARAAVTGADRPVPAERRQ